MKHRFNLILVLVAALVIIALVASPWLRSEPVKVDTARAERGALQVTVNGEGKTRVKDRFTVAAPVAGRLARITLRRGDQVKQGTLIARIDPMPLAPLDPRQRAEAGARIRSAEASKREADAQIEHIKADLEQARRERARAEQLARSGDISREELEQKQNAEMTIGKDLEAARFKAEAAAYEVEVARSALLTLEQGQNNSTGRASMVTAPASGQVLRVLEESERVITAGTPLIELSNPSKLEIVIDVLSIDAVRVKPGARVLIDDWGGGQTLEARVRLIEPSAFTKVSALGIEEQRVNVVADFVGDAGPLGDGYRVEAHIVTWEDSDVLKIPTSALFRHGQSWSVFVVENGEAARREIETGHRTTLEVEVKAGLEEGAEVIIHPSKQISDGVKVEPQENATLP